MVLPASSDKKARVESPAKVDHKDFKVFGESADALDNLAETDCREREAFLAPMVDLVTQVNKDHKDCQDQLACPVLKATKELQEVTVKWGQLARPVREVIPARKDLLVHPEVLVYPDSQVNVALKGRQELEVSK